MWSEGVEACKSQVAKIIGSACPKCGNMEKSGKISCCGRGGSWFRNCGSASNAKLDHTWYEGIQACKARARFKTVIGQHLVLGLRKRIESSRAAATSSSKAIVMTFKTLTFTSVNTSALVPRTMSTTMISVANITATNNTSPNILTISTVRTSDSKS